MDAPQRITDDHRITDDYKQINLTIPQAISSELHNLTGYHVETFRWILFRYGEDLQLSHKVFIDCYIYIHMYLHV